jgi:CRP-like cAMP-binding protein
MHDEIFSQSAIFKDLTSNQIKELRQFFVPCSYSTETVVFEQGNLTDYIYLVIEGEINIIYKPEDGPEMLVARVGPGGVVGWSAAVGSPAYTSSAVCITNCELLRIRGDELYELYVKNPETGRVIVERLAAVIAERLKNTHHHVISLLEQGLRLRKEQPVNVD